MKVDRIIAIIMILMKQDVITAKALAQKFEVTRRTIYRDIETISLSGVPIVTYPGTSGGIGIMKNYKLDKHLFTKSDISTLIAVLEIINDYASIPSVINTLQKVKSLIPSNDVSEIEIETSKIKLNLHNCLKK